MASPRVPGVIEARVDQLMAATSTDQALLLPDGLRVPINNPSHVAICLEYHKQQDIRQLEPKLVSRCTQDAKSIFRGYGQRADMALLADMLKKQAIRGKNCERHSTTQRTVTGLQIRSKNRMEAIHEHPQEHIKDQGVIGESHYQDSI